MNKVVELLFQEYERLQSNETFMSTKMRDAATPAIVSKQRNTPEGEIISVDYLYPGNFSPEQRQKYDYYSSSWKEQSARLNVLKHFIKSMVPAEVIESFDEVYTPLETYQKMTIPCNQIELDKDGQFTRYSIKVGPLFIESPYEMSFQEYQELYISSLQKLLIRSMGQNITEEDAMRQLKEACTQVYLKKGSQATIMEQNLNERANEIERMVQEENETNQKETSFTPKSI